MANYQLLKADIDAKVYENAHREITGENLNAVLNAMVTTLGAEYQFAGVATIGTNPGSPDAKVFYIANGKGTYTNFGGIEVTEDEVVVLYYDTEWHKVATGIASQAKLSELGDSLRTIILKNGETSINNLSLQLETGVYMSEFPLKIIAGHTYKFELQLLNPHNGAFGVALKDNGDIFKYLFTISAGELSANTTYTPTEDHLTAVVNSTVSVSAYGGNPYFIIRITDLTQELVRGWMLSESFTYQSIVRDSDGNVSSANIVWADKRVGTLNITRNTIGSVTRMVASYNGSDFTLNISRDENDNVITTNIS